MKHGFKLTDMHGGMGVIPEIYAHRRPEQLSLRQMFGVKRKTTK